MSAESVLNRKALRDYEILDRYEVGIELKGTEVKSIRLGHVSLQGSFARLENGQVFLYDSDIQPYQKASHEQHEPKRRRRLLLHRHEIDKLEGEIEQMGRTLVPLKLYWKKNHLKIELGVGKGKVAADKRADLKKRVVQRETDRTIADLQRRR